VTLRDRVWLTLTFLMDSFVIVVLVVTARWAGSWAPTPFDGIIAAGIALLVILGVAYGPARRLGVAVTDGTVVVRNLVVQQLLAQGWRTAGPPTPGGSQVRLTGRDGWSARGWVGTGFGGETVHLEAWIVDLKPCRTTD
jgi:hypothetical protein